MSLDQQKKAWSIPSLSISFSKKCMQKLSYDFRVVFGISDNQKALLNGQIIVGGKDVTEEYVRLFQNEEKKIFRHLVFGNVDLNRVWRFLRTHLYPRLCSNGPAQLSVEDGQIDCSARRIGNLFLGEECYDTVLNWLSDDENRRLFKLEILQGGLISAGVPPTNSSLVIGTEISLLDVVGMLSKAAKEYPLSWIIDNSTPLELMLNASTMANSRMCVFILKQYQYNELCAPRKGDVFFDCGAFCGDTVVWAIDKVGGGVAFEPLRKYVAMVTESVSRYPNRHHCDVFIEKFYVGEISGPVSFEDQGTDSHQSADEAHGSEMVDMVRIDDWAEAHRLWLNFIKMDIEGGDVVAIKGAERTLKERRPELAISVYHKPAQDLWEIPSFIKKCVPSYKFYLKKASPLYDTVMFALSG